MSYDRATLTPGILHLGLGAFHRAHQADYTEDALAAEPGPWGIESVSMRNPALAHALTAQDGRYALIENAPEGPKAKTINAILRARALPEDPQAVLARMADPAIRIVTITVTEKGYGAGADRALDPAHPSIAPDLAAPETPHGVVGLITEALRRRRDAGAGGFTALSCDNLSGNGALLRGLVAEFAQRRDPDLARWIDDHAAFPNSMVDRITPAPDPAQIEAALGAPDPCAVVTEPFRQWVIENRFAAGRPAWDAAGAQIVTDVAPYELMKLRMLNGAHSLLAYAGPVAGLTHVRDAMADETFRALVAAHMQAAAATLPSGLDHEAYAQALQARFANPAIAHRLTQIAADGTQKLPQRVFAPAQEAAGPAAFAFIFAAWARYALGEAEDGASLPLDDPRAGEIRSALKGVPREAGPILDALAPFQPEALASKWRAATEQALDAMLQNGMRAAIRARLAAERAGA